MSSFDFYKISRIYYVSHQFRLFPAKKRWRRFSLALNVRPVQYNISRRKAHQGENKIAVCCHQNVWIYFTRPRSRIVSGGEPERWIIYRDISRSVLLIPFFFPSSLFLKAPCVIRRLPGDAGNNVIYLPA